MNDTLSRNTVRSNRIFSKRIKFNGLSLTADTIIWKPKPGETLMVIAAYVACMEQTGTRGDTADFILEVNNSALISSTAAPNVPGRVDNIPITAQVSFTNSVPLTLTVSDVGVGNILRQELILFAKRIS